MQKVILLFLIASITISCSKYEKNNFQNANKKELSEEFNKYFHLEKTINLDSSILVARVSFLDVNDNGKLLVTDATQRKVFLFSSEGSLIKELKYTKCNPGYKWHPMSAKFKRNGDIIIRDRRGPKFSSTGECTGEMVPSFIAPFAWDFLSDGKIVGYYAWPGMTPKLSIIDNNGNELDSFGKFSTKFRNILARGAEYAGLAIDEKNNIYQLNPFSMELFKYDINLNFSEIKLRTNNFNKIEKDIRSGSFDGPLDLMSELNKVWNNKTTGWGISLLNEKTLIVYYLHNTNKKNIIIMQLYSTDGKYLLEKDLRLNQKFEAVKNGYAYKVIQPEPNANGNLPNPAIEVYSFTGAAEK